MKGKEVERKFQDDPNIRVVHCDLIQASSVEDGVLLTMFQSHLSVEEEAAITKPIARVFLTWPHFLRTRDFFLKFAAGHKEALASSLRKDSGTHDL